MVSRWRDSLYEHFQISGDSEPSYSSKVEDMLTSVFGRDEAVFADGYNTPLRGDMPKNIRPRLLDYHLKLGNVPIYDVQEDGTMMSRRMLLRRLKYHGILNIREKCTVDRFISRRGTQGIEAAQYLMAKAPWKKDETESIDVAWRKRNMARALEGILPFGAQRNVLKLSQESESDRDKIPGSLIDQPRNFYDEESKNDYKWPVKPRRRPCIIDTVDTILDMPNFQASYDKNLLDWSARNHIAVAINRGVCLVDANFDFSSVHDKCMFSHNCTVVKYDNSGNQLIIGREVIGTVAYDVTRGAEICRFTCHVSTDHQRLCSVRAVAWTKDDKCIVVGCGEGDITVFDIRMKKMIKNIRAHSGKVSSLCFSPNNRFLASAGMESIVGIYLWPELELHMHLKHCAPVRALAWHPWESAVLCTGVLGGHSAVSLWNIQREIPLDYYKPDFNASVDTLSWNKLTGELVVNWSIREGDKCYVKMPVLASFQHETDTIVSPGRPHQRIYYAMWNPDGDRIACQVGESIFIYKFLDDAMKDRYLKRKKTVYGKNEAGRRFSHLLVR